MVAAGRPRRARRPHLRHQLARPPRRPHPRPTPDPWRLFTLGGTYEDDNLTVKEAAQCMRIRGPLAQTLHALPDGADFHMTSTPPPNDPDLLSHHEFKVLAHYSTLLVQDDDADLGEPDPAWFDPLVEDWINTAPGVIGIGAARPFTVPVTVDVRRTPPAADDAELRQADHVTQAGLALPSGRLLISTQASTTSRPASPSRPAPTPYASIPTAWTPSPRTHWTARTATTWCSGPPTKSTLPRSSNAPPSPSPAADTQTVAT